MATLAPSLVCRMCMTDSRNASIISYSIHVGIINMVYFRLPTWYSFNLNSYYFEVVLKDSIFSNWAVKHGSIEIFSKIIVTTTFVLFHYCLMSKSSSNCKNMGISKIMYTCYTTTVISRFQNNLEVVKLTVLILESAYVKYSINTLCTIEWTRIFLQ